MENLGNGVQTAWNPGFSTLSMPSLTLKQSFGATATDGIDKKMLDRLGKGK
jgi:hypothetical protein